MGGKSRHCAWDEPLTQNDRLGRLERALRCAAGRGCGAQVECSELALEALRTQLEPAVAAPADGGIFRAADGGC